MESTINDSTHVSGGANPSRAQLATQKTLLDEINRNQKELENFLNMNTKMRVFLNDCFQGYIHNNEERFRMNYHTVKDTLKNIEANCLNFNHYYQKIRPGSNLATKEDFVRVFQEKNAEIRESLQKFDFFYKYNFTISIFKPLLDIEKDEMLREILKEDYISMIKSLFKKVLQPFEHNTSYTNPPSENPNEVPETMLEELNRKFQLTISIGLSEDKRVIYINVSNSFQILLKFSAEFLYMFKMTVCLPDEYISYTHAFFRQEKKFSNLVKRIKPSEKSNLKSMRKINLLFEDKLNFFLRYAKSPTKMGLYMFITWLSNYNDLFKKRCAYCKKLSKLNLTDKCFYPPFYKILDMESEIFLHDECYNSVNNSFI